MGKGYLTARDILNFMKDNGIENVGETETRHMIKYFDSTEEERLYYTDYL